MTPECHIPNRTSLRAAASAARSLAQGLDRLQVAQALRRELDPELARIAADLYELRGRAGSKLGGQVGGLFTRKALEQASRAPVARARAAAIGECAGPSCVLDATCGIGADAIALAEAGHRVVAADRDPLLALLASENLLARGLPGAVVVADATRPAAWADFVVVDPDRRPEGRRTLDPEGWSPPLTASLELAAGFEGACIKLPPATDVDRVRQLLPPGMRHRLQWVSCDRELCEVALWTGRLAGPDAPELEREALALEGREGGTAVRLRGQPVSVASLPADRVPQVSWLAEPDPAVIRSGLLGAVARATGLAPIGPGIAFLVGTERPDSPWLRTWRVLEVERADPKRVRAMLARRGIGAVQVLKRGHPDPADVLERRYRGPGEDRGTLAVARLDRGHAALLLEGPLQDP
jgi:hypothetical protein